MTLKKITLLYMAISLSTMLQSQPQATKDMQQVQQAVVNMFQALSDRDSLALKSFCTHDITLYEYGQVWNLDTLIRKAITMNQSADFKRSNTFAFLSTTTGNNLAWVTYRLNSAITRDGKQTTAEWLETVVLTKEKKQWKVKHLHSTLLKRS